MYKDILHPAFHCLLDVESNKGAIEKQMNEAIHKVEYNLFKAVLINFAQRANAYFKVKYPLFTGNLFVLDGLTMYFNYKDVFHVYNDDLLGEKFNLFNEQKNELLRNAENELKGLFENANLFEKHIQEKIQPLVEETFKDNLFYQQYFQTLKFEFRKKKEQPFVEWKACTGIKMKADTSFYADTVTEQVIVDSLSVEGLSDEEIVSQAVSKIRSIIRNIEGFAYGELRSWIETTPHVFLSISDSVLDNDPSKAYAFKGRKVIVTPAILNFDEQQKEQFLTHFNTFKEVTEKLVGIHRRVANEFTWTTDSLLYGYALQEKVISVDIQNYEVNRLLKEIQDIREQVLLLEFSSRKPEQDLNIFKRFYVVKVNEYQLGEDKYEVFNIRGKRKIKVRTFKNGVLLSVQQQSKAYHKHLKQQGLSS